MSKQVAQGRHIPMMLNPSIQHSLLEALKQTLFPFIPKFQSNQLKNKLHAIHQLILYPFKKFILNVSLESENNDIIFKNNAEINFVKD